MKKLNLTIGCYYNNYINNYELKDGEDIVYIEEEIYQEEVLKPLFDDETFYGGLIELFDNLGIDEMRIKKDKDGCFEAVLSSQFLNQTYRSINFSPTVTLIDVFSKSFSFCLNEYIEQSNVQMISVIESIGDLIDTMKRDGFDEYTIYLKPNNKRDDRLIHTGFDLMNSKDLFKQKKEWEQMYQKYCEIKDKYNFKDIIFDREKHKVTFKF